MFMKKTTVQMINYALDKLSDNEDEAVGVKTSIEFSDGLCDVRFDLDNGYSFCMTTFESWFDAGDIDGKEEYKQEMSDSIYAVEMYIGIPDRQTNKITKLYNRVFVTNECYSDMKDEEEFKVENFTDYIVVDETDQSHSLVTFDDVKKYIEYLCSLATADDEDSLELSYSFEV